MKKILTFLLTLMVMAAAFPLNISVSAAKDYQAEAKKLDKTTYSGELGAIYSKSSTTFRVWAPTSDDVKVKFYKTQTGKEYDRLVNMKMDKKSGVWSATVKGDLKNTYYTYEFKRGKEKVETYDLYAKACAVNGKRSMVVDLGSTNPDGWDKDRHITVESQTDAMIWEVHVGDFSSSEKSGVSVKNRGKYLAFTETGTTVGGVKGAASTCVDYLKELGVNYVQINPFYDFGSVDETDTSGKDSNFNWGYDPINYNIPEGSYSSNAKNSTARIKECKAMIAALHKAGIGVIMDVVYNHTHESKDSAFNKTVPDYYYRINPDGSWSNGSGCGNDTASERAMFRKYMTDSVLYWVKEYHVDGFRFDLMGLHDVDTMNHIREKLDELDGGEKLIMYGEAWKLDTACDDGTVLANQENVKQLSDRIGAFDDTFRDALKGSASSNDRGFVQSGEGIEKLKTGITAQCDDLIGWADSPTQCVTYSSCHDNLSLWDKLVKSVKSGKNYRSRHNDLVEMNKLAGALTFTSQGTSFILAGEEFCRSKDGDNNSYKSGVGRNQLDWTSLQTFGDVSDYYRGLIQLRKRVSAFRDPSADTARSLSFIKDTDGVLAYTLEDDELGKILVAFNGGSKAQTIKADGDWVQVVNSETAGLSRIKNLSSSLTLPAHSAAVLINKSGFSKIKTPNTGKVIVKYTVDSKVFKSYVVNGKIGKEYNLAPLSSVLINYNVLKTSGDRGKFSENIGTCTFECEKYEGSFSSVSFECVDDKTDKVIFDTTVLTNRVGQPYETLSIPSVKGYTLNLQKLPSNGCGTFGEKNATVRYYYTKKPKSDKTCRVNIVYMSTDGKILGTNTLTGDKGTPYETTQVEIEKYNFKTVTGNASGTFAVNEENVLYIYSPVGYGALIRNILLISGGVLLLLLICFGYYRYRKNGLMKKLDIS